jgi:hypothetical protein
MTRRVLLIGPSPITEFSAAFPRLRAFEEALAVAGWSVTRGYRMTEPAEPAQSKHQRPRVPAAAVRFLARIGIADEVQVRTLLRVRRLLQQTPHDAVVMSAPPFSLVACSLFTSAPVVLDYRDVFASSTRPHLIARCLAPLEAYLTRRANAITFAGGQRLGTYLVRRLGVSPALVHRVPNGVVRTEVGDDLPGRPLSSGYRPLDVVWAGHLYGFANLSPILRGLEQVGPAVAHLEIIGPTPVHTRRRYAPEDLPTVSFKPALHRAELYRRLARADVGLIVLNDGYPYEISVPAKYYDYVAVGMPILYIGPKGAALQEEPGSSLVHRFAPDDHDGICNFLRAAATSRLPAWRTSYVAQVDRANGAAHLVKILEAL